MLLGSSGTLIVTVNEQVVAERLPARRPGVRARRRARAVPPGPGPQSDPGPEPPGDRAVGVRRAGRPEPGRSPGRPRGNRRRQGAGAEELRRFAMQHDGDARRGEALFFDPSGLGCGRCHSAGGRGTATIGPDLTGLALKYDRAELIRSVLEPSSRIAVGYQPVVVATRDGRVLSGVVRAETADAIELADAEAKITRIPKRDIDVRRAGGDLDHAGPGRPNRSPRPSSPTSSAISRASSRRRRGRCQRPCRRSAAEYQTRARSGHRSRPFHRAGHAVDRRLGEPIPARFPAAADGGRVARGRHRSPTRRRSGPVGPCRRPLPSVGHRLAMSGRSPFRERRYELARESGSRRRAAIARPVAPPSDLPMTPGRDVVLAGETAVPRS